MTQAILLKSACCLNHVSQKESGSFIKSALYMVFSGHPITCGAIYEYNQVQ
jgi:hypothetical protein